MPTSWPYISKFKLKNWEEYDVEKNDIIVFVWANNCWKSTILKEIDSLYSLNNKDIWNKIIDTISVFNELSDNDFYNLIISKSKKEFDNNWNLWYKWIWYSINGTVMDNYFNWGSFLTWRNEFKNYHKVFSSILTTKDRLSLMDKKQNKDPKEVPTEIYHIYSDNPAKFLKVKTFFGNVFWKELSYIPQYHGAQIFFKVSDNPLKDLRFSDEWYIEAQKSYVEAWDIDEQWDWMKSYAWIITNLVWWEKNTYYIDEPESFLHPPQAYYLWQQIWEMTEWQIFIATHSQDFIKWLLKTNSDRVRIFRILRELNECSLIEINKSELNEIQNDAFLHYSNFLDSLFNHYTIVCEDQSDCLFYNKITDISLKERDKNDISVNYVYIWWKEKFPRVYTLLKKWWLKFALIGDIDVLNDFNLLERMYWENVLQIKEDYDAFKEFVQTNLWEITITWAELKQIINNMFWDEDEISKNDRKKIEKNLEKLKGPWDQFKNKWKNIFW